MVAPNRALGRMLQRALDTLASKTCRPRRRLAVNARGDFTGSTEHFGELGKHVHPLHEIDNSRLSLSIV